MQMTASQRLQTATNARFLEVQSSGGDIKA
jgi:hypothetical protein